MPQGPDDQVRFLANLQRMLDEGLFVASYKFALLFSLADLLVENGGRFRCCAPDPNEAAGALSVAPALMTRSKDREEEA
jgi:hypothetical protein